MTSVMLSCLCLMARIRRGWPRRGAFLVSLGERARRASERKRVEEANGPRSGSVSDAGRQEEGRGKSWRKASGGRADQEKNGIRARPRIRGSETGDELLVRRPLGVETSHVVSASTRILLPQEELQTRMSHLKMQRTRGKENRGERKGLGPLSSRKVGDMLLIVPEA